MPAGIKYTPATLMLYFKKNYCYILKPKGIYSVYIIFQGVYWVVLGTYFLNKKFKSTGVGEYVNNN